MPEDVRALIARRYQNQRVAWLAGEGDWPMTFPLGCPSETQAVAHVEAVRVWVAAWRSWQGAGEVEWQARRWRSLGTQSVPERVVIRDAGDATAWIGESHRWVTACSRYRALLLRRPALRTKLPRYFDVLAEATDAEISRIEKVLGWLDGNATRELYPRQIPIAGLDTKWLESRAGMVSDLWGGPLEFRRVPLTARVRLLDPRLSQEIGRVSDVCAPVEELAALSIQPSHVWVVENLQTGLAFAPLRGSVVFMGLGYGVSVLSSIPWVRSADCIYWGRYRYSRVCDPKPGEGRVAACPIDADG